MELVLFTSPSCQPCKMVKETFANNDFGIATREVNVEEEPHEPRMYAVRSVPTILVLGSNGDVLAQHTGALGKAGIEDLLRRAA